MAETEQRELSVRAIIIGGLLTFVFTAANIYFGLRVGLTFSTAIPAAVISMAVLRQLGGSNMVENNIVQTLGSAAGAVGTMIFILPAFVIIGWWQHVPYWPAMLTSALGGVLGVMLSVPLRRALVIDSDLPYPEGHAGAEILRVGMAGEEGARENREGLATIVLGGLAGAGFGVLTAVQLAATEISKSFRFLGGATSFGGTLSLGVFGIGHLIGLATGMAMLLGALVARFALLPWLSLGIPGPVSEVAATAFSQQVRFVGAGAIGIAALWSLVRISGSIVQGIRGIMAAGRARSEGHVLDITERDVPGPVVAIVSLALMVPIAVMLWQFDLGGAIVTGKLLAVAGAILFVIVIGSLTAIVAGYMAGLIGSSNSPISGIGILSVVCAAMLVAALAGGHVAPEARQPLIAFALFVSSFVFGIAIVANDNLQDLKTGQLVGSTPWKQQAALIIGVVLGSLVLPPVLELLNVRFGFAGAPGAGPNALAAPQSSLFAGIAQGVLGGTLRWDLVGIGVAIGVATIVLDEVSGALGKMRLPPMAVAMGIYLPVTIIIPTVIGTVVGHVWDKMADRTPRPEYGRRLGVLLATGLVVGDSLLGLVYAGAVGALGDPARLALVGPGFATAAEVIGLAVFLALLIGTYVRTKRRAFAQA
jgi:putative OPT family oligopeptide transporter